MAKRPLILIWDNFGPLHVDRINAVSAALSDRQEIIGLELCGRSDTYDWTTGGEGNFRKITLFPERDLARLSTWELLRGLIGFAKNMARGDYILCHFNVTGVFFAAIVLRLMGNSVFTMGCSKFDDRFRRANREFLKTLFLMPYQGALASGIRSIEFYRFLGIKADRVVGEYNTVSLDRIRTLAGMPTFSDARQDEGPAFHQRGFITVARLVPKKNLTMLLRAYALYAALDPNPRDLHLLGSGPELAQLKRLAQELGIAATVTFHGFVQTDAVARQMAVSLALLLPSIEEQFGNVVPEAQALGLPVILSDNAGARDNLIRNAQNGFVIEPDNPEGLAYFMEQIATNESLWLRLRQGAFIAAPKGDTANFAEGVKRLINRA